MSDVDALRDREADAEGALRIARATLDETEPSPADSVRIRAEEAVAAAERTLRRTQRAVLEADAAAEQDTTDDHGPGDQSQQLRPLAYESVDDWVRGYLQRVWRRKNVRWCRRWWEHAEALGRLEGLWRAWEQMRWEGGAAMVVYYRDYLDPMMYALTDPSGTFARCTYQSDKHELLPMVEVDLMPLRVQHILRNGSSPGPGNPVTGEVQLPKGSHDG